jgi:mannosyl-3-phosphoglycerate phosphatase
LLDHYNYSFDAALPVLNTLQHLDIPLILVSSKTRAEILAVREQLANRHPFIVENGAAVFIPQQYFPVQPEATVLRDGYWVREMAPSRARWLKILGALAAEFPSGFEYFQRAGISGIMQMTGLSEMQAARANDREYSEPVKWLGAAQDELRFIARLREAGATVSKGGRFLSVSGDCDKGRALRWLRDRYQALTPANPVEDIAIGDSANDCLMLEAARTALLIRSPVHDFPPLAKVDGVIRSQLPGPDGWAEGVAQWLQLNTPST